MPIYEFVCRDCGNQFEQLQSFSAKGHPPCPNCRSMHVSRMLGKPAIHFKGSGWYITDSKGSSKQSANGGEGAKEGVAKEESAKTGAADSPKESSAPASSDSSPATPPAASSGAKEAAPKV